MLIQWGLNSGLSLIEICLSFLDFPETSSVVTMLNGITSLMNYVFSNCAGIFFFFIPQSAFFFCMDILFILWIYEPIYWCWVWVARKIPFLGIK